MKVMDVYTKNGKEIREIISYEPDESIGINDRTELTISRPVPHTTKGEIVRWSLGGICNICEGMIDDN